MINGFKVITLCGSTRFKDEFLEAQKRLTLEGNVVISVGLFGHSGDKEVWTEGVKDMLDRQHLAKIDLADEIFVVNVGGYIGDSTRREIAYAEFKGKTITYLESSKKLGIYENYDALCELYNADRISDEIMDLAELDFKEKRRAAIAEYNSCKGPWPYQWKNIDAVVCGILQLNGLLSIDFYDLQYLYEADSVSEIRIKGRGSNDEEQVQSIIDTICKDYMDLLKSSKKLAVTIIGSSKPEAYLEKFAECLTDMDVVWQTRTIPTKREIEISLVTIMETNQQYKLKEWSKWTLEKYLSEVKHVGQDVATSFYNQSDLSRVKECELMIIGINPGCGKVFSEWELKDRALSNPEFLYRGNPCFDGLNDKEIIYEMSQKYDEDKKRYGWDLWHKIHKMLGYSGKGEIIENIDKFVLTNMVFFGTSNEGDIPKEIDQEFCAKQTLELIDILNPKVILLLGLKSKSLFETVSKTKMIELEAKNLSYCIRGNSVVFAIKHTARFYSNAQLEGISHIICSALDCSKTFEEIIKIVPLKQLINPQDSNLRIDSHGRIVYTYWCNSNENYKKENGTISIGLEYDKEDHYELSILTKGNHPELLMALVNENIDKAGVFRRDSCNTACFIADAKSEKTEVATFINGLLSMIKNYREKDFPQ